MNFISLECSTKNPSVSIFIDDKHLDRHQILNSTSSDLPMCVNKILEKKSILINDIDFISTTIGPGTFTGVRVGLSFSQGLAYSLNVPIVPINVIELLNSQVQTHSQYVVGIYSHKDLIIYKCFSEDHINPIVLDNVNNLNGKNVFGVGLENFEDKFNYTSLRLSSLEVGEYALENYQNLAEFSLSSIKPIYLNEFKRLKNI